MIDKVKQAKLLREQGAKNDDISDKTGIHKNYITPLIELYNEMEDRPVKATDSNYVSIRKSRYMIKSLKIQHRIREMRFLREKIIREHRATVRKYVNAKQAFGDVAVIQKELDYKQSLLNITSSNLEFAQDGHEYLTKQTTMFMFYSFLGGFATVLVMILAWDEFVGDVKFLY